jgi:serine-type D-Ala-D-Ala endopeptidase (penicillin-binding protein 7)
LKRKKRKVRRHPAAFWWGLGAVTAAVAVTTLLRFENAGAGPAPVVATARVPAAQVLEHAVRGRLGLQSESVLVLDDAEGVVLYDQNADRARPIASLTKLMTAMVVLDAQQPLEPVLMILNEDRDRLRGSRSRLEIGTVWSRGDLLAIALLASDNRAAAALGRNYPGGTAAFVQTMNAKAVVLGMTHTRFGDASGLSNENVSTARDLALLARAAESYPLLRELTSSTSRTVIERRSRREWQFGNTNRLVGNEKWQVGLSKTGYTADAGNCLLMRATVGERPVVVVLLNSWGALSKYGDSTRIRDWLLNAERRVAAARGSAVPQS